MGSLRRNILEIATFAYLIVMVWGGLVPFDLTFATSPLAASTWFGLPVESTHWADIASNVALYIPLGLLIRATLWKWGWWSGVSFLVSVLSCVVISYAIEFAQIYSAMRVSSAADFACNLAGGFVGVVSVSLVRSAGFAFADILWSSGHRWREGLLSRPSAVLAQVCAVGLLLAAASPFDLTFSPNLIYKSASQANWAPFDQHAGLSATITNTQAGVDGRSAARRSNDRWQRTLDYPMTVAGYLLLAVFTCRYLKKHCSVTGTRRTAWTIHACVLLAVFCFGVQLFVLSRSPDVTDIILALVGATVGVMIADRLTALWMNHQPTDSSSRVAILGTVCLCITAVIIARELSPFRFAFGAEQIGQQLQQAEILPLRMYQTARLPVAAHDILSKLGRFALLGGLFVAWRSRAAFDKNMGRLPQAVAVFGVLVLGMEVCQLFLPARTPSVTDVLLAGAGVATGVVLLRTFVGIHAMARQEQEAIAEQPLFNVAFDETLPTPTEPPVPAERVQESPLIQERTP
ncbi:MAG: VanZ family protein [Planctomycetes bacterium]|nr:VanZ family protein [Planctomycetota bacterium]